jgi:hypothetical protein
LALVVLWLLLLWALAWPKQSVYHTSTIIFIIIAALSLRPLGV